MNLQVTFRGKWLLANFTLISFFPMNWFDVLIKVTFLSKTFLTLAAYKILFFSVGQLVSYEMGLVISGKITNITRKPLLFSEMFELHMGFKSFFDPENCITVITCKKISWKQIVSLTNYFYTNNKKIIILLLLSNSGFLLSFRLCFWEVSAGKSYCWLLISFYLWLIRFSNFFNWNYNMIFIH